MSRARGRACTRGCSGGLGTGKFQGRQKVEGGGVLRLLLLGVSALVYVLGQPGYNLACKPSRHSREMPARGCVGTRRGRPFRVRGEASMLYSYVCRVRGVVSAGRRNTVWQM